jgi:hypothetical protein
MIRRIIFYSCAAIVCAGLLLMLKPGIDASRAGPRGHTRLEYGMASLRTALTTYALDNDEQFPPDLQILVDEKLLDPRQMCYPWLDPGPVTNVMQWTSIIYFPGFSSRDSRQEVIAVTLPVHRKNGTFPAYAVRINGSMFLPTDEELPQIMKRGIGRLAPTTESTLSPESSLSGER